MVSRTVKVNCPIGLGVEPAGKICDKAVSFKSRIIITYGEEESANAKSILSILGAVIKDGQTIQLTCEGPDEEEAIACMADVLEHSLAG